LPMHRRARYQKDYALSAIDAGTLTAEGDLCLFFEACIDAFVGLREGSAATLGAEQAAKWLLNAGAKRANERDSSIERLGITPAQIARIIDLRDRGMIGS